jgi:hypothetical protein
MGKFIDISSRISNELPTLKITDDIIVTVNNRTKNVLLVQAYLNEKEKSDMEEMDKINGALGILIGQDKADKIRDLDLPLPEYQDVFNTILSIATNTYQEGSDTPR